MSAGPLAPPAAGGPPPNWYPDPLAPGGWRWWDGHTWTPFTSQPATPARKPRLPRWLSVPVVSTAPLAVLVLVVYAVLSPLSVLAAIVPLVIVLPTLAWLDRLEPEPISVRVHALLWGATVAIIGASITNGLTLALIGEVPAIVLSAPITEEAFKALGIWWAVRRGDIDDVTDGVVFAGWVAMGFAAVEDVTYFAEGPFLAVFVLRGVFMPFAHPLFTIWTGIAVGRAVRDGRPVWPAIMWGYLLAVATHMAWNGSLVGLGALDDETVAVSLLVAMGCLFVALFVAVVVVLVRMRRAEQARFVAQWPFLTRRYGLAPDEQALFVSWDAMLAARKRLSRRERRAFDAMRAALHRLSVLHRRMGQIDDTKEEVLAAQLAETRRVLLARR